jgi:hypothetical protein
MAQFLPLNYLKNFTLALLDSKINQSEPSRGRFYFIKLTQNLGIWAAQPHYKNINIREIEKKIENCAP